MPRGEFDRSARRAQTRARLLQAAARVYARRGFAGATLDEVAADAGFTKGAVYDHFGSKENLLVALLEEHLTLQVGEQIALFDRDRSTWERPLAGSERWMEMLDQDADPFRLFVELWSYAQRDERLRSRLAGGLAVLRTMFTRFGAASSQDAGVEVSAATHEQFANVVLGLALGLPMLKLVDSEEVPDALLGTVLSILSKAVESSEKARAMLAEPGSRVALEG